MANIYTNVLRSREASIGKRVHQFTSHTIQQQQIIFISQFLYNFNINNPIPTNIFLQLRSARIKLRNLAEKIQFQTILYLYSYADSLVLLRMFLSVFTVSKIFEKPGAGNARVFLNSGSVFYFDSHSVATEIDNTSRQCRIVLSTQF